MSILYPVITFFRVQVTSHWKWMEAKQDEQGQVIKSSSLHFLRYTLLTPKAQNCHFVPSDHQLEAVDAVENALHLLEPLAELRHLLEQARRRVPLLHLQEVLKFLQAQLNVLHGVIEAAILKSAVTVYKSPCPLIVTPREKECHCNQILLVRSKQRDILSTNLCIENCKNCHNDSQGSLKTVSIAGDQCTYSIVDVTYSIVDVTMSV